MATGADGRGAWKLPMTTPEPAPLAAHLRILETTDLHSEVMAWDYFADRPTASGGLARAATLIRALRAEVSDCLLLDDGDFLQGNPMSDWAAEARPEGAPHPVIAAMNALGYDAATLGNHEFNYGLPLLHAALAQATFPVVCANVSTARGTRADAAPLVPPWTLLDRRILGSDGARHPLRIGIIGLAPPQIAAWERFSLDGVLATRDIVETARALVPALKAAGAEIVVALCHAGIGADAHTPGMENAAVPLAAVPGIDVILMGHTHGVFPGPDHAATGAVDPVAGTLHGKPAVMAGFHGSHVGVVDLTLERGVAGWRVAAHTVTVRTPQESADPAILAALRPAHDAVLASIRRPVAHTDLPLSTHFAFAAPAPALGIVAAVLCDHARAVLAPDFAALPLLVAVAPYKAGGKSGPDHFVDIPPGPLVARHAAELYPFPNGLCVLRLTGRDVADWLEVSAAAFATVAPGIRDQPLRDPAVPGYNFDVVHGLRYVIDPARPVGARISGLTLADGTPLRADAPVLICTNGYRAGGGGGFAAALRGTLVHADRHPLRDIVLAGLRRAGTLTATPPPVWRFARVPGASAWLDAGRGSAAHLPTAPLHALGPTDAGFERYRLDLDAP